MLEWKIGCLGPQRGRLPWATQQMTNDGRSFALPITVKKFKGPSQFINLKKKIKKIEAGGILYSTEIADYLSVQFFYDFS